MSLIKSASLPIIVINQQDGDRKSFSKNLLPVLAGGTAGFGAKELYEAKLGKATLGHRYGARMVTVVGTLGGAVGAYALQKKHKEKQDVPNYQILS